MTTRIEEYEDNERSLLIFPAHRSYRRLPQITGRMLILTLVELVALELLLFHVADWLASLVAHAALALVPSLHPAVTLVNSPFLGVRLKVLSFILPSSSYVAQLLWLLGSAVVLAVAAFARRAPMPLRVVAGFAAVLVGASAYYVTVVGQPGFDGFQISTLYIRTAMLVWLLLPILLTAASLALPFTPFERIALPVVCIAVDVAFAIVRYAFFIWFIGSVGPIPLPMLYLLFGPALDFMSVVAVASIALVRLSHRLDRTDTPEPWSWI
jgi:hypothetical protein